MQWLPLVSRFSLLIFRSCGQRWRPNCWFLFSQYLNTILLDSYEILYRGCPRRWRIPNKFRDMWSKGQTAGLHSKCCLIYIIMFDAYHTYHISCLKREHYPYCFFRQKSRSNYWSSTQYLMNHLLDNYQTWFHGCL